MADAKAKSACERYDKTIAQINAEKEDLEKRKSNAKAWLASRGRSCRCPTSAGS